MQRNDVEYSRRSESWKIDRDLVSSLMHTLLAASFLFGLSGCATKPWSDPLGSDQADKTAQLVDELTARDAACGGNLQGDILFTYQSPFDKKTLSGFLEFSFPSSFKFVMTNPFGQPFFVVAGDQSSFQTINSPNRQYLAGSLSSFGLRHNITAAFLQGAWGDWLTGRNSVAGREITALHRDRDNRGIWVSFAPSSDGRTGAEHLLLAPEKKRFLARIVENSRNDIVAEISYSAWTEVAGCSQPVDISITGLDYGAEIHIELAAVAISHNLQRYSLPVPRGYIRRFMP